MAVPVSNLHGMLLLCNTRLPFPFYFFGYVSPIYPYLISIYTTKYSFGKNLELLYPPTPNCERENNIHIKWMGQPGRKSVKALNTKLWRENNATINNVVE